MSWEIVVGIETHAQLLTRSKIFSGASTDFGAPPNRQACAVDIALPGVLPVPNRAAVEHAIRFGLAVSGTLNRRSIFARKNYFYPDLPKGYQISQYENPIVQGGEIRIAVGGSEKTIRLTRAHLEEDAGKSIHGEEISGVVGLGVVGRNLSGIDLNRAGTPLLEIVSEPDLRSAQEAVAYARTLHALVVWYGICDGNMQEGSFRCDANVSVRREGDKKLGTRCEIKNLNSFRFMEQAIDYEARRQIEILQSGGKVEQETRLYDPERNETRSMRTKEEAHDYRYFPDPDLLPLVVPDEMISQIRSTMPKSREERRSEFMQYGSISAEQAAQLTSSISVTTFALKTFQGAPREGIPILANWIVGPLSARLNEENLDISESKVDPDSLRALFERVSDGTISNSTAVAKVLPAMWSGQGGPDEIIEKFELRQISDAGALEKLVDEVLAKNARQVEDYRAGKEKAFNSLVGQVMKATQGKANPAQVNDILRKKLKS
ncbi:MAG TPA: Asp-tRNA(Asn)/Glu-tRNA(Gln) amidotransferase subunit GatB [Burkholderiales bacterium]|nr:Asp-tRNA(Asn)/Glu-tRNA(Gln) amidotransferase subunit GatB [Burkholderiales bacterium]